jgi:phospholipid transport system substrate-binding protein
VRRIAIAESRAGFVRTYRLAAALVVLAVLATTGGKEARAGEPTDQVRGDIEQVYEAVQRGGPAGEREGAEVLDQMFDWTRMSEAALGKYWPRRSAAEQAEFARVFGRVFRSAYLSRIHVVDASRFQYLGDVVDGDRATVKTTVFTRKGSAIGVDYLVRREARGRWRVEDVRVERVSLVGNYRVQFDTFITRSSYEALVKRLEEMGK